MNYQIKSKSLSAENSFITGNPIEKPIHDTLALYDRGEDISNSPFIQAGEWKYHADQVDGATHQTRLINLYESIKKGYNGSPILVWFDKDGYVHLYDGFHRIAIMNHLGMDVLVNAETEWKGIDGSTGTDFPLAETLLREYPKGHWLYQPLDDERLSGWKVDRTDSAQRLEYILENLSGKTVLDIGCSEGYFSRELAKRGFEVTAIDRGKGLISSGRYLSAINNADVDYHHTPDWKPFVDGNGHYDNILLLSVIHNDMKEIGVEAGIEKLKSLRNKTGNLVCEFPGNDYKRCWNRQGYPSYDFTENKKAVEDAVGMALKTERDGLQKMMVFQNNSPWWSLNSWMLPERTHYKPLLETLKTKPCRRIMEIGTYGGNTSIVLIKAAAEKVPEEEIEYYGFDLFEDRTPDVTEQEFSPLSYTTMASVKKHIERHTKAKVTLFKGNTKEVMKDIVPGLPKMDLIYIDGGHAPETTKNDWRWASQLMGKDTVVYFDDYNDEMPFIGAKCITAELKAGYRSQVMPEVNYYPRPFGRFKSQLLKVELAQTKMRFHLLGLPHSQTTKEWVMCPFTQLAYKMSEMLTSLGHEVIHYGTEGSDLPCTEHVDVLSTDAQKEAYGDWDPKKQLWIHHGGDLAYTTFRRNAIEEINKRKEPGDILLVSIGNWMQEVARKVGMTAVEPFVGYLGYFCKYKVFPSYAWMHHLYGMTSKSNKENFVCGNWYDAVIPHYFNPDEFAFCDKKEDYFLYVGRLIPRKGVHILPDICKRVGAKLIVAGQTLYGDERRDKCLADLGLNQPHVEYIGTVDRETRNELMGKAKAVLAPSLYMEPFGKVVVEAMLCGTPVITTDWGSFPEIVKHGEVGYRCRTMDDFVWAAKNVDKLNPTAIRKYAEDNYSMERVKYAYQEYFMRIHDILKGKGWYQEHPERENLDWLRRY